MKSAFQGLVRVLGSPALVLCLWLVNLVVALPLSLVMMRAIEESIGASLVHEELREGLDLGWYGEFEHQAKGLEESFRPSIVGAGAVFDNLEAWFNGSLFEAFPGLVAVGVVYAALWALFLGGILHRYSERTGPFRLSEFLSRGGAFFFRFLRLAALSAVLYYLIYRFSGWLFGLIEAATRDVTVERTVLSYVAAGAVLVVLLLGFVNMVFDYAKIAAFKENRRSMVLAAVKGLGFVLSNLGKTLRLYLLLGSLVLLLVGVYALVAPGPGQSTASGVLLAFFVGQVYLVAKLVLRLTFYAGQMALYESAR